MIGRCWVNGDWLETSERIPVIDPATEEIFAELTIADYHIVDKALSGARNAQRRWSKFPARERIHLLHLFADRISERAEELAVLLSKEVGKPITLARAEVKNTIDLIRYFAEESLRLTGSLPLLNYRREKVFVIREPVGVVGAITPFNYPLSTLICKLIPALAVGCSVVAKPDEHTPFTTLRLAQLAFESGLPEGVFNVITGPGEPTGRLLVAHKIPRLIAFTGSVEVGKEIQRVCASRVCRTILELGGNCAAIVCDDAKWQDALSGIVEQGFKNSGQYCYRISRVYVAAPQYRDFVEAFIEEVKKLRLGHPMDPSTRLGPLNNKKLLSRVRNQVASLVAKGLKLLHGGLEGCSFKKGYYFLPTVLACKETYGSISELREEIFGPVVILSPFRDIKDAIDKANATPYGLAGYLFTQDLGSALEWVGELEVGCVWINRIHQAYPEVPFGGVKESGLGREKSRFGIEEFTELKTVYLCY